MVLCLAAGIAIGAAMGGGGSTSKNVVNTIVNTSVDVTNRAVMELSSRGRASNSLVVSDTAGDVVIEGMAQDAAVTVTVEGFLQATNSTSVQQEVAQKLSQMAESVTSGLTLGGKAEAENITNTTINNAASILNETKVLCSSEGDAENSITVARTGGSVAIRNVTQNAAVNSVLRCQSSNINSAMVAQKTDQSIEQTATAVLKGLDLGALLIPLIIIAGLVVLFPLFIGATVTRTTTGVVNNFLGENFPAVVSLVILGLVAAAWAFLLPFSPLSSKGKVEVTCVAELEGGGGCRDADHPTDPALLFPFVLPDKVRRELGAQVGEPRAAESLDAAVAAARAEPRVRTLLWDRDARTWQGFAGKPDPKPWLATFDADGKLVPSPYVEPGTRANVLELTRRATNLARGLYCIACGVSGAFDPADPSKDPSASLCRSFENTASEGFTEVNGERRPLPREDVPDPAEFDWQPLGRGNTTSNLWASADPAMLFLLLAGRPGAPAERLSVCLYPAQGAAHDDVAACPSPDSVVAGIVPGLAFLDEMGERVRAQTSPAVSPALFREWRRAVDLLRADVARGYEHYHTGHAGDFASARNVLALFPVRVGKAGVQQKDDWKVYLFVGMITALGFGAVALLLARYRSMRDRARAEGLLPGGGGGGGDKAPETAASPETTAAPETSSPAATTAAPVPRL